MPAGTSPFGTSMKRICPYTVATIKGLTLLLFFPFPFGDVIHCNTLQIEVLEMRIKIEKQG